MSRLTSRVQHIRYGIAYSCYRTRACRYGLGVLSMDVTPGFPTIFAGPGNRPPLLSEGDHYGRQLHLLSRAPFYTAHFDYCFSTEGDFQNDTT